tara:strand:+ start:1119 stop:3047 length:1929 start_codon:yes stop_codon:yes gene_type:complete
MKTVYKPWGKEIWLELNDRYCYKRIYINAKTKTSYQYHNKKLETNYIIEGTAEVWLENDEGVVEKKIMNAGDFFTVKPPRKHRVIAITDVILQEVSTPEVDDVIRITDDSNRQSGKLEHEHMKPAFCILAAGVGSRLERFSQHTNKGLLPLDNKAIISHLIDKTPSEYDIVVVLGYKSHMVKEYCNSAHPERNFIFVEVDRYEGPGTGPGYSIAFAKQHLQRPFVWAAVDTIITGDIPAADCNWMGLYPTSMPEHYATADVLNGSITSFKNKSKDGHDYAFIGLAGVYDYDIFWRELEKNDQDVNTGEIVSAYYNLESYQEIKSHNFDWYDIGTVDNYFRAKNMFEKKISYSIPKTNGEFLYKVGDSFIKMSSNENFVQGRIKRADTLGDLVPKLEYCGKNLYSYRWVEGTTLYDCNDVEVWKQFLYFLKEKMWKPVDQDIKDNCIKFYKEKTSKRLGLFLSDRDISYCKSHEINGSSVRDIHSLLNKFDWSKITSGLPTKLFHGDLQFDNVLLAQNSSSDSNFCLLDWRQDFADSDVGDVYYDLSKMYGGVLMSYKLMKDEENFSCEVWRGTVKYSYKNETKLEEFKKIYEEWVVDNGYDLDRIKAITSLIYLNMAPLHEKEFGNLLFFKSKEMLEEIVDK